MQHKLLFTILLSFSGRFYSVSCCPGLFALKIFIYLYYILEFFCESRSEVFSSESVKVKFTQLCPTLSDPVDYVVHGILQARILEWLAFPSPGDLPNPGIEPRSPALQAYSLSAEPKGRPKCSQETHKMVTT